MINLLDYFLYRINSHVVLDIAPPDDSIQNRRYEAIALNIIFVRAKKFLNVKKLEFQKLIILLSNSHWLYKTYLQFHWVLEDRQKYVAFADRRWLLETDTTNSSYNSRSNGQRNDCTSRLFENLCNFCALMWVNKILQFANWIN